MAIEFPMPKLGLTMDSGTIIRWLVDVGAEVTKGDAALLIETDKVESEVEANGTGRIHITGVAGETYACGDVIGWFLEPGEQPPTVASPTAVPVATNAGAPVAAVSVAAAPASGGRLLASPNARRVAAERGVDLTRIVGTGPGGRIVSEDVAAGPTGAAARVSATTFAKDLARELGVDLSAVRCNGPDPRIDRADVVRHVREQLAARAEPAAPPDLPLFQEPSSTIPMTGMRGRIAQRMHTSLQSMAQLTLTMDVDMGAVAAHRAAIDSSSKPRYTDYIVAAAAGALAQHPIVNSQIADGHLALLPEINVGLAVAVDGGLVVPVVQRADTMSLDDLSAETARLAEAARSGTLSLADLEGGTFSVTALGMFGVDVFTPVINPPNTAILGVGRLREGTRWDHNVPVKTTVLTLSLTWDHRAFDGAPAAEFVASIRDRLEAWGSPG